MRRWLLFPLLMLVACTGSSEPALQSLLAVGLGNEVRFYQSSTLQPGNSDSIRLVGTWGMGEGVVDLVYRRNLAGGNDQLWVLTPGRLRRYNASSLTLAGVGTPEAALDGFELPTGVVCSRGYLRLGNAHLLLVCPDPATTSTALPTVWRIPLGFVTTGLPSTSLPQALPLAGYPVAIAQAQNTVRFALRTPSDQLLYLSKTTFGVIDPENLEAHVTRTLPPAQINLIPTDLIYNANQAVALLDREASSQSTVIRWNLTSTTDPTAATSDAVTVDRFGQSDPINSTLILLGTGFASYADAFRIPPEALIPRSTPYTSAVVGLDQFLYLAQGAEGQATYLRVIDLAGNLEQLPSQSQRTLFELGLPSLVRAMAFIPVEDFSTP